jgi:hypothetical protein
MEPNNNQQVKGCSKCGAKKNEEKKCKTCNETKQKLVPYVVLSILFFGFAIYGFVVFTQKMMELFSK